MATELVIEHEILKALYDKAPFIVQSHGSDQKGHRAIYKREYKLCTLELGIIADIIHHPERYADKSANLQYQSKKVEEVGISEKDWIQISEAIEVLESNGHIKDDAQEAFPLGIVKRTLTLTHKGAIDYRNGFYLKGYWANSLNKINKEKEQLDSSIRANKSTTTMNEVVLPKNFSHQIKIGAISGFAAIVSVVFIVISTIQQCNESTDKELKLIKEELQNTGHKIDTLSTSLKEINKSIQTQTDSTKTIRQK